jgi:nucleolar GTP-binding protein
MTSEVHEARQPPWLERHVKALTAKQLVDLFKQTYVPTDDEIVRYVGERYRRIRPPRHKDRIRRRILFEYRRLELVYNIVTAKLRELAKLPPTKYMNEFHATLIKMFVGDEYDNALRRVKRAIKLANEFWNNYRLLILSATDPNEAKRFRKEGCGRILSLIRRMRRQLDILRRVRDEIVKTHVISEGLPVAVVAGIPSAGKSTLVRTLSTAEPAVADYPFTTKTIIVGKSSYRELKFYVVDTPGLLEKPFENLNEIERKALTALLTLPDVIVFLFDPSPTSYVDVGEQLALYNSVKNLAERRGAEILAVVNKIDIASKDKLTYLRKVVGNGLIEISALHRLNIETLLAELYRRLRRRL